jgi:hypothetical protein
MCGETVFIVEKTAFENLTPLAPSKRVLPTDDRLPFAHFLSATNVL